MDHFHCLICYQKITKSSGLTCDPENSSCLCKLLRMSPSKVQSYEKIFQSSSFCHNCSKSIQTTSKTIRKLEELENKLVQLKNGIQNDLIDGYYQSQVRKGQSQDKYFQNRNKLAKDLKLIDDPAPPRPPPRPLPTITIKGEENEEQLPSTSISSSLISLNQIDQEFEDIQFGQVIDDFDNQDGNTSEPSTSTLAANKTNTIVGKKGKKEFIYCYSIGCQYRTRDERKMEEHICKSHLKVKSNKFKCQVCQFRAHNDRGLKAHEKIHNNDEKLFICSSCGKSFRTLKHLNIHEILHDDSKKVFKCDAPGCNKRFIRITKLNLHKNAAHSSTKFVCDICNKEFTTISSFEIHKKVHMGLGFSCDVCKKIFGRKSSYDQHIMIHLGTEPFPCNEPNCTKKYTSKSQLLRHIATLHKKEKEFVCPYETCNKRYGRKSHLNCHIKTHDGRQFACAYCDKSFLQLKTCRRHEMNIHKKSEEKIYLCDYCGRSFSSRDSLYQHLIRTKCSGAMANVRNNKFRLKYEQQQQLLQDSSTIALEEQQIQVLDGNFIDIQDDQESISFQVLI